ncbi:MAG: hypothetical protein QGI45_00420, partial [Myxococcota bacterium]|nr:hypothetical protein [Myxococcota bacterium]
GQSDLYPILFAGPPPLGLGHQNFCVKIFLVLVFADLSGDLQRSDALRLKSRAHKSLFSLEKFSRRSFYDDGSS